MDLDANQISYKRLEMDNLPLIYDWITNDRVVNRFWGYGKEENYHQVTKEFSDYISGVEPTDPYLILYNKTPIGYIQMYKWLDYPDYEQFVDLTNAAGIDLFITGEYRNKGLGQRIIARFLLEYVFNDTGIARCVINPEVNNVHAIKAYEKVGFQIDKMVSDIPGEPGPVYFMSIERDRMTGNDKFS
ncbi:hypothetical protein AF332_06900 [Sporosarcina globispora]|uniref:N-acetyltransferase domain-containing protein n=1 Tax=Sporosarcina globispora TaxID=1459 RepID=A0A0M0G9K0_SPOGL|nr:GNAT family N-acetyltransferase [Sporosarcina globispora]KON86575.1 hypothetical protein AF332_06900 [Sporosarcina globispora]